MAAKKAATSDKGGTADSDLVVEAYGDALKNQVKVFFDASIDNHQEAEQRFLAGLKGLRDARDRALQLIE